MDHAVTYNGIPLDGPEGDTYVELPEDGFLGPMEEDDGEIVEFRGTRVPVRFAPTKRRVHEAVTQTSDPILRVCVHEIARALEEFAR